MVKIKTYNDCMGCPECKNCGRDKDYTAECIVCDECGQEELETAYVYEGQEYCRDCLIEKAECGYGYCEKCNTLCDNLYSLDDEKLCDDCFFANIETIGE